MLGSLNDIITLSTNLLAKDLELTSFSDPKMDSKPPVGFWACAKLWLHQHTTDSRGDATLKGEVMVQCVSLLPEESNQRTGGDTSPVLDPVDLNGSGILASPWYTNAANIPL
jgi:hypothetical protein